MALSLWIEHRELPKALWNIIPSVMERRSIVVNWNVVPDLARCVMPKTKRKVRTRDAALSRTQIVTAAIDLLDRVGEEGLTFKVLAAQLATGPGAIYGHIASKNDLVTAAADAIVAEVQRVSAHDALPRESIAAFALGLFDAIDAHPWIGAQLARMPDQAPLLRILEAVGQDIRALGVPADREWASTMAVLNYIVGVGGHNAANAQFARAHALDRTEVLASLADTWSDLDPADYPFARSIGTQLRTHDDRADYLAGIDFLLTGIAASTANNGEVNPPRGLLTGGSV